MLLAIKYRIKKEELLKLQLDIYLHSGTISQPAVDKVISCYQELLSPYVNEEDRPTASSNKTMVEQLKQMEKSFKEPIKFNVNPPGMDKRDTKKVIEDLMKMEDPFKPISFTPMDNPGREPIEDMYLLQNQKKRG